MRCIDRIYIVNIIIALQLNDCTGNVPYPINMANYRNDFIYNFTKYLMKWQHCNTFVLFNGPNYHPLSNPPLLLTASLEELLVKDFNKPIITLGLKTRGKLRNILGSNSLAIVSFSAITDPIMKKVDQTLTGIHSMPLLLIMNTMNIASNEEIYDVFKWCWEHNFPNAVLTTQAPSIGNKEKHIKKVATKRSLLKGAKNGAQSDFILDSHTSDDEIFPSSVLRKQAPSSGSKEKHFNKGKFKRSPLKGAKNGAQPDFILDSNTSDVIADIDDETLQSSALRKQTPSSESKEKHFNKGKFKRSPLKGAKNGAQPDFILDSHTSDDEIFPSSVLRKQAPSSGSKEKHFNKGKFKRSPLKGAKNGAQPDFILDSNTSDVIADIDDETLQSSALRKQTPSSESKEKHFNKGKFKRSPLKGAKNGAQPDFILDSNTSDVIADIDDETLQSSVLRKQAPSSEIKENHFNKGKFKRSPSKGAKNGVQPEFIFDSNTTDVIADIDNETLQSSVLRKQAPSSGSKEKHSNKGILERSSLKGPKTRLQSDFGPLEGTNLQSDFVLDSNTSDEIQKMEQKIFQSSVLIKQAPSVAQHENTMPIASETSNELEIISTPPVFTDSDQNYENVATIHYEFVGPQTPSNGIKQNDLAETSKNPEIPRKSNKKIVKEEKKYKRIKIFFYDGVLETQTPSSGTEENHKSKSLRNPEIRNESKKRVAKGEQKNKRIGNYFHSEFIEIQTPSSGIRKMHPTKSLKNRETPNESKRNAANGEQLYKGPRSYLYPGFLETKTPSSGFRKMPPTESLNNPEILKESKAKVGKGEQKNYRKDNFFHLSFLETKTPSSGIRQMLPIESLNNPEILKEFKAKVGEGEPMIYRKDNSFHLRFLETQTPPNGFDENHPIESLKNSEIPNESKKKVAEGRPIADERKENGLQETSPANQVSDPGIRFYPYGSKELEAAPVPEQYNEEKNWIFKYADLFSKSQQNGALEKGNMVMQMQENSNESWKPRTTSRNLEPCTPAEDEFTRSEGSTLKPSNGNEKSLASHGNSFKKQNSALIDREGFNEGILDLSQSISRKKEQSILAILKSETSMRNRKNFDYMPRTDPAISSSQFLHTGKLITDNFVAAQTPSDGRNLKLSNAVFPKLDRFSDNLEGHMTLCNFPDILSLNQKNSKEETLATSEGNKEKLLKTLRSFRKVTNKPSSNQGPALGSKGNLLQNFQRSLQGVSGAQGVSSVEEVGVTKKVLNTQDYLDENGASLGKGFKSSPCSVVISPPYPNTSMAVDIYADSTELAPSSGIEENFLTDTVASTGISFPEKKLGSETAKPSISGSLVGWKGSFVKAENSYSSPHRDVIRQVPLNGKQITLGDSPYRTDGPALGDLHIEVFNYSPFPRITVSNMTGRVYTNSEGFNNESIKSVKGYILRIPMFMDPPMVFLKNIAPTVQQDRKFLTGSVGHLFNEFAHRIKANLELHLETNVSFQSYETRLRKMGQRKDTEICLNPYSSMMKYSSITEGSYPFGSVNACVIVPVVPKLTEDQYIRKVYAQKTWNTMHSIFFIYFLVEFFRLKKHRFDQAFLGTIFVLAFQPLTRRHLNQRSSPFKVFHCFVALYAAIMYNLYIAGIGSLLTSHPLGKQIESVQDLLDSGLKILVYDFEKDFLVQSGLMSSKLLPALQVTDYPTVRQHRTYMNTTFAYIVPSDKWALLNLRQIKLRRPIFRMPSAELCTTSFFLRFPIQWDSPFADSLHMFILRAAESGLDKAWTDKSLRNVLKMKLIYCFDDRTTRWKPLSWTHYHLTIFNLIRLTLFTTMIFVFEIMWFRYGNGVRSRLKRLKACFREI